MCVTFEANYDGHTYTLRKNNRIKWAEFYTVLRDGKPFGTVEYKDDWGWRGTFSTKDWRSTLWMMSEGTTLDERVKKMHDAHEESVKRLEFI